MTAQTYLLPSDHAPDCLLKRRHPIFISMFHLCSLHRLVDYRTFYLLWLIIWIGQIVEESPTSVFSLTVAIFILLLAPAHNSFCWQLQSSKQAVTSNKGKEKMIELPAKGTDMWELPLRYQNKGITIGSPLRPPPPVHENAMISKSKDQSSTDMRTGIKKRKRRNKQQNIVELEPSCRNRICPQDVVDAGIHLNPAKKKHSAWFSLTPSCDQNRKNTLQLLVEPYVQIIMEGNCNPDVSILMKYIVLQLKHVCQQEVGIFMNGKLLAPEMKLLDVVKQWMAIVDSERKITKIGSSAENFCVKLTYARRE